MKIFRGWYRKSLTKGRWHRVFHVSSVLDGNPVATTICAYYKIPAKNCDFSTNPDNKCIVCENKQTKCLESQVAHKSVLRFTRKKKS